MLESYLLNYNMRLLNVRSDSSDELFKNFNLFLYLETMPLLLPQLFLFHYIIMLFEHDLLFILKSLMRTCVVPLL